MVESDLGQQTLKAEPPFDGLTALAEIVVDGDDAVAGPAQRNGPVGQGVRARRGLFVIKYLLRSRLADLDDRQTVEMPGSELG